MAKVVVVWILLSLFWGSTWMSIKIGLQDLSPFWLATGRLTLALIPLWWLTFQRRYALPKGRSIWALLTLTGILNFTTNHGLVFWAELHISSALAAVLFTFMPLFGMVFSHYYRRTETFTFKKLCGVVLAIIGVAAIFQNQLQAGSNLTIIACLAVLAAAIGVAFSGVLVKAHLAKIDIVVLTTIQMTAGTLPLFIAACITQPMPSPAEIPLRTWLVMAHLGLFGSAAGFLLSNWLLKTTTVSLTQLVPIFATLVAVVLGWFVLGEPITVSALIGCGLIFLGLLVVQSKSLKFPIHKSFFWHKQRVVKAK